MAPSLRAKEGKLRAGLRGERGEWHFSAPCLPFRSRERVYGGPLKSAPGAVPKEHMVLQQPHIADSLNKERVINI
jgi:hypothetical protein